MSAHLEPSLLTPYRKGILRFSIQPPDFMASLDSSAGKESACNAGNLGSIPGLERSPGEGKGYPLQYSGLENSMDGIVHGVPKSQTRLSLSLSQMFISAKPWPIPDESSTQPSLWGATWLPCGLCRLRLPWRRWPGLSVTLKAEDTVRGP